MRKQERIAKILELLDEHYSVQKKCWLEYETPWQLLIATILSAQCTDRRVNMVTETLFRDYPDAESMGRLTQEQLEGRIRECGLYRMKAQHILAACRALTENYGGRVPNTREELMKLPGVGQKTAGVVLMAAFGDDQIPVDTHVFRLSNRIGLAKEETPEKVENALRRIIPEGERAHAHHLLIWHGRRCCTARKPECERCCLKHLCKSFSG